MGDILLGAITLASLAGAAVAAALAVPHHLQLRAHRRTGASR
ncbi:hypothetical protein [Novosphingobium capsulatum]|nr:hypothetical protein [Novosphingobium capsulatum]WQD92548.1 hypothetical protein U0041_16390 [Novosphingobium capsulatum]